MKKELLKGSREDLILPIREFTSSQRLAWRNKVLKIYGHMAHRREPYDIRIGGFQLTVLPKVYAPGFFTDSLWFAQQLPTIVGNGSLLEIGTGTGIIVIACAINGANVVATDINPFAVENARANVRNYHLNVSVREGNLYDSIQTDERFNFIVWAHPFNNWDTPVNDILLRSGMDYNYEGVKGYIAGAKAHLHPGGRLLLGTGDTADLQKIALTANDNGYSMKLLKQTEMPLEPEGRELIKYLIYEFCS